MAHQFQAAFGQLVEHPDFFFHSRLCHPPQAVLAQAEMVMSFSRNNMPFNHPDLRQQPGELVLDHVAERIVFGAVPPPPAPAGAPAGGD